MIAIKSCRRHRMRGDHEVIRYTWGKDFDNIADVKFFEGLREGIHTMELDIHQADELLVNAPDDYDGLPYKTREILRYAIAAGYDYTFLCDTDTFIIPDKLMKSGFEQFDYAGMNSRPATETFSYNALDRWKKDHYIERCWPWMSGGVGYFVSKKAAKLIVEQEPNIWAEDLWVGQILFPLVSTGEIKTCGTKNIMGGVSWHFPQGHYKSQYDPKFGWMEKMYKENR